ncbi:MAG: aminopeptidase [marine bacterium B5-7]|nr:MAG: aminopeptidase [marine bacterium B5-7]
MSKPRGRELGLRFPGQPGPYNAVTDVEGVLVGSTNIIESSAQIRTGVTAILPRGFDRTMRPVWAGICSLNGNGEMTGSHWIADGGYFFGPICLTNTHSVGIVHHGTTRWMIDHFPSFKAQHAWALPVVAETYDGTLNDINGQHLSEIHVRQAIEGAKSGPVDEGNVGGGTGMVCYEFKGGTGTSSRTVGTHTVAALVQANHGMRDWFTVLGVPVGKYLREDLLYQREMGSIIVILATDAPMMPHQLQRLARRATIGIGLHGTPGGNNSGDIFLAFSTANPFTRDELTSGTHRFEFLGDDMFDAYYMAAVQATEEAVINAMLAAEDMTTVRPEGKICRALNGDKLMKVMNVGR